MSNLWTIQNDPPPNPGVGNALNGLKIVPVLGGTPPVITGYQLVNGANVLASSSSTSMPVCFNSVSFASRSWNICANVPTVAVNGSGTWGIVGLAPEDEATGDNGEFTAQAGTGIDPDEAASSAYA